MKITMTTRILNDALVRVIELPDDLTPEQQAGIERKIDEYNHKDGEAR